MKNAFQQAASDFAGYIGDQARAIPQIFAQRRQNAQIENIRPKEGFVFGKRPDGTNDPNYQIARELVYPQAAPPPTPAPQNMFPQVLAAEAPQPTPPPAYEGALARNPNVANFNISPEVSSAIQGAAQQYGIPAELLGDIALQESSFDPTNSAARGGFQDSTAAGLYMFNDPTWDTVMNYANMPGSSLNGVLPNTDRMDPQTAALAAAYLIRYGQLGRWDESRNVWGPYYRADEVERFYQQSPESFGAFDFGSAVQ